MKDLGLLLLAGAIVVTGILGYMKDPVSVNVTSDGETSTVEVGAASGPDHTNKEFFHSGIEAQAVSHGPLYATTTAADSDFTALELCNSGIIVLTPAAAGAKTVNVASSSSMFGQCIPDPGDQHTVLVYHATTSGTNGITWADTGANTEHIEAEGATTVLDNAEQAYLTFTNVDDTIMLFEVSIRQAAD